MAQNSYSAREKKVGTCSYDEPTVEQRDVGYCTYIHSASQLSIQLQKYEDEIYEMMDKLSFHCESANSLQNLSFGTACVALYSDGVWYRAIVKEVFGEEVSVHFVDYGNIEKISISAVKELPPECLNVPKTCVLVSLNNIDEKDIDLDKSKLWLEEKIFGQLVSFDVQNFAETSISVILHFENTNINNQLLNDFKLEVNDDICVENLSRKRSYNCHTISAGTLLYAICTCVDSINKCLQLQLISLCGDELLVLMEEITNYCKTTPKMCQHFEIGMPCLAFYGEDSIWYRGEIISIQKDNLTVQFVDYGNTDNIEKNQIYEIPDKFLKLPKASVAYNLSNKDHVLKFEEIEEFLEELLDQDVDVDVIGISDSGAICGSLRCEALFPVTLEKAIVLKLDSLAIKTEKPEDKLTKRAFHVPSPDLEANKVYVATCVFIESTLSMKCQLSSYQKEIDQLTSEIETIAEEEIPLEIFEGVSCLAKYSVDGTWYRGKVIGDGGLVEFIDYGNIESVLPENIRVLPQNFAKLPQASITVLLHDVCFDDLYVTKADQWLRGFLLDQTVEIEVVRMIDPTTVEAYVYVDGIEGHINDNLYAYFAVSPIQGEELCEETLEVATEIEETIPEKDTCSIPSTMVEVPLKNTISQKMIPSPQLSLNGTVDATCFIVDSSIKMRCQLHLDGLDDMMEKIAEVADATPVLEKLETGKVCLAKFSVDEAWYRGRIVKENRIEFVDYGNEEEVEVANVRILPEEFTYLPQMSISVSLHDVHMSDIDPNTTTNWLENNLSERNVKLEIMNVIDPVSIEAYVYQEGSDIHINDLIYTMFALPESEASKPLPECLEKTVPINVDVPVVSEKENDLGILVTNNTPIVDELNPKEERSPELDNKRKEVTPPELIFNHSYNATCFVVETATILRCQLHFEGLDELMSRIAKAAEDMPQMENLEPGALCLAKYSVDDGWYRGRVLENSEIEFIDYGNKENVASSYVRDIPVEFLKLPQMCVLVTLHDVQVNDIDGAKTKNWLKETLLETDVKLEVISISTPFSIEAYVFSNNNDGHVNDEIYNLFALELCQDPDEVSVQNNVIINDPACNTIPSIVAEQNEGEIIDNASAAECLLDVVTSVPEMDEAKPVVEVNDGEDNQKISNDATSPSVAFDVGKHYQSTCFVVISPVEIKCQLHLDGLEELMDNIAQIADSTPNLFDPTVGSYCLAKYSVDNIWYRGKIMEDGTIEFIDYGNIESVSSSDIKDLCEEFQKLPQMSVSVFMHDVHLPDIDATSTKSWLEETLLGTEVSLEVVSIRDTFSVEAYVYLSGDDIHINDKIYEKFEIQLLADTCTTDVEIEESPATNKVDDEPLVTGTLETEEIHNLKDAKQTLTIPSPILSVGSLNKATCFLVDSAVKLRCQLHLDGLEELMENIALVAEEANVLTTPDIGHLCLAKYKVDNCWYRGRVLENGNVEFVDYGNIDQVPSAELREISRELLLLPQMCISVILTDVKVNDIDTVQTQSWLETYLLEKDVSLQVTDVIDNFSVKAFVFLPEFESHINDKIYEEFAHQQGDLEENKQVSEPEVVADLALNDEERLVPVEASVVDEEKKLVTVDESTINSPGDIGIGVKAIENDAIVSDVEESEILHCKTIKSPVLVTNNTYNATCFVIDSPITLRCQLHLEGLDELMEGIAAIAEEACVLQNVKVGEMCLAKYDVDHGWYRGRVLGSQKIEFVDYGNVDKVSLSDIKEISEEFLSLPQMCITVTLHDVHLNDIDSIATKLWLEQSLLGSEVLIEIISISDLFSVSGYVYLNGSEKHVNDEIYENFAVETVETEQKQDNLIKNDCEVELPVTASPNTQNICVNECGDPIIPVSDSGESTESTKSTESEPQRTDSNDLLHESICKEPKKADISVIPSAQLEANVTYNATCFVIKSAFELSCQLHLEGLDELMEKIAEIAEDATMLEKPNIGQFCLAKCSMDGCWYRGEVMQNGNIEFLDYGNVEVVHPSDIKVLPDEYTSLPRMSVNVTLREVNVDDIDATAAKTWLEEKVLDGEVKLQILSNLGPSSVEAYLYISGIEEHINDKIYDEFALMHDAMSSGAGTSTPVSKGNMIQEEQSIPRRKMNAKCLSVTSEKFLICQVEESSDFALFTLKGVFKDTIDTSSALKWLKEVCLGKVLTFEVANTLCEDGSYNSVAFLDDENKSINKQLHERFPLVLDSSGVCSYEETQSSTGIENSLAGQYNKSSSICIENVFSWPILQAGAIEDVVITKVENGTTLWCQMIRHRERMRKLTNKIALEVGDLPIAESPKEGDPCIAYHEDLFYYRARIVSLSETSAKVEFVDNGVFSEVSRDNIRVISKEMLLDHVLCFKCVFKDVFIDNEKEADAISFLEKNLVVNAAVVSILLNEVDFEKETVFVSLTQNGDNVNEHLQKEYGKKES